jgi:hypothetical protein
MQKMTKTQKEIKEYIRNRDKGKCCNCNDYCWESGAQAHRISNTGTNIKIYGKAIIDHRYNLVWACMNNICNASFNIGNNLGKSQRLVKLINDNPNNYFSAKYIGDYINE